MQSKLLVLTLSTVTTITFASATVTFSEIMYDPEGSDTGREWIEVRNDGDTAVLTSYKFFESNVNHGITSVQGGSSIPSGGYAIIADNTAKFLEDFPSYKGILFDSSFSLSNAGEYIALKDSSGSIVDSVTYSPSLGGQNDGSTLSFIAGSWTRGNPTPGAENVASTATTTDGGSGSTSIAPFQSAPGPDLTLYLPEEKVVLSGADSEFKGEALTSAGTEPVNMKYEWAFGDGGTRTGKSASYHYIEPGLYTAIVEASNGLISSKGRMKVRVIDPNISIESVAKNEEKISVGIKNDTPYELDMSSWQVDTNGVHFTIPKNTVVAPKMVTKLNGIELGMSTSTFAIATTSLRFPGGKILASSTFIVRNNGEPLYSGSAYAQKKFDNNSGSNKVLSFQTTIKKGQGDGTLQNIKIDKVGTIVVDTSKATSSKVGKEKDTQIASFLKSFWPFHKELTTKK